ncbi:hypothetical protein [Kitasatospora sp. NPDC090091]|uniref:hypothetical protein n=1 Tax=Kitasatospora sp. NPDC090091 TaxID=3364081 RepID=UPI003826B2B3
MGSFDIIVHHDLDRLRHTHTVIVPGVADVHRDVSPYRSGRAAERLREKSAGSVHLFALAAAGLPDRIQGRDKGSGGQRMPVESD